MLKFLFMFYVCFWNNPDDSSMENGRKNNRINEPITLSCPSTIVEYHDYHSLTHNKITVNHKLVTMETHTRVKVVYVAMEIVTKQCYYVTMCYYGNNLHGADRNILSLLHDNN